jgi:diguanylate cyclase (GGDEF)-like protein
MALALIACVYANPLGLFRGQPTLDQRGGVSFLAADYGPLYHYLWLPFTYGVLTVTVVILARAAVRGAAIIRARSALLLAATIVPMVAGASFILGLLPWPNFNPAVASFSLAATVCTVVLVRYHLLDLTPLARDMVIDQLHDGVIVVGRKGRLVDFNPAAGAVLPELTPRALGQPLAELLSSRVELLTALHATRAWDGPAAPVHGMEKERPWAPEEESEPLTLSIEGPDSCGASSTRYFSLRSTPLVRGAGECLGEAIVLHDITRRVELYRRVRRLAATDELTGLLTRRRLLELGEQEINRSTRLGQPLSALLIDLDGLKPVNDEHGHAAGDLVLRRAATACAAELRSFDLIGRYGGDELCALLPSLDESGAMMVAERLRAAVAGLAIRRDETPIPMTVSIGVATCHPCGEGRISRLIEEADLALYSAKEAGRDRVEVALPAPALSFTASEDPRDPYADQSMPPVPARWGVKKCLR